MWRAATAAHAPGAVQAAVHEQFDGKGDPTILDYICAVLEDEHFDFGDDGAETFEAIGPFLVRQRSLASAGAAGCAQLVQSGRYPELRQPAGGDDAGSMVLGEPSNPELSRHTPHRPSADASRRGCPGLTLGRSLLHLVTACHTRR